MYILRGGGVTPDPLFDVGVTLDRGLLVRDMEGGVRGLDPDVMFLGRISVWVFRNRCDLLVSNRESNLSMSACEKAAPTTLVGSRLFVDPFRTLGVRLRQNGGAGLLHIY